MKFEIVYQILVTKFFDVGDMNKSLEHSLNHWKELNSDPESGIQQYSTSTTRTDFSEIC